MNGRTPLAILLLLATLGPLALTACEPDTGTAIGERSRIVSDKDPTGEKLVKDVYKTPSRLISQIQSLTGAKLYDFQLDELVKIDAALSASFDDISRRYIEQISLIAGIKPEQLEILRPQIDTQTVSIEHTVLYPYIEAKRQRKLSTDQKALIAKLDRQRRLDMTHLRNRYANQVSAITGLPLPDVYGVLTRDF